MALREELELDIEEALSGADRLGAELSSLADSFKRDLDDALDSLRDVELTVDADTVTSSIDDAVTSADATVEVEANAEELTASVDAALAEADATVDVEADAGQVESDLDAVFAGLTATVPVDADTDAAQAELETLAALADATDVVVDVDADTTSAEDSVEGLGDAAGDAAGDVDSLATSTSALAATAGVATGDVTGLAGVATGLGGRLGAAAGAAVGLGAGLSTIFQSALSAEASLFRLQQVAGSAASQLDTIDVGSLSAEFVELNTSLGSVPSVTREAAASIITFGTANGATREQAAGTAEQMVALAARAVALNPALGQVGDVTAQMGTALARGGRFAQQFSISLTPAEINARALADTGKATTAELTQFDKAAAGAALAAERYGGALQSEIAEGAQNPIIQLRSLAREIGAATAAAGQPLIIPMFDLFRAGIPIATSISQILGSLGSAILPAVAAALSLVAPIVSAFANGLSALGTPVITAGAAIAAFIVVLRQMQTLAALGASPLSVLSGIAGSLSNPFIAGAAALGTLVTAFGFARGGAEDLTDELQRVTEASGESMVAAFEALKFSVNGVLAGMDDGLSTFRAFEELVDSNIGAAERLLPLLDLEASERARLQGLIDNEVASRRQANADTEASTDAIEGNTDATGANADATGEQAEQQIRVSGRFREARSAIEEATRALDRGALAADNYSTVLESLIGRNLSVAESQLAYAESFPAIEEALRAQQDAFGVTTLTLGGLQEALITSTGDALTFAEGLVGTGQVEAANVLLETHRQRVVDLLTAYQVPQPEIDAFLQKIGLTPATIGAANDAFGTIPGAISGAVDPALNEALRLLGIGPIAGEAGSSAASGFGTGIGGLPGEATTAASGAAAAITNQSIAVRTAATTMGETAGSVFGGVLDATMRGGATRATIGAGDAIASAAGSARDAATNAGINVGASFGQGIVSGINSYIGAISSAAANAVRAAESAARAEADASSPSKLFAALGADLGAGLTLGFENEVAAFKLATRAAVRDGADTSGITAAAATFERAAGVLATATVGGTTILVVDRREAERLVPALRDVDPKSPTFGRI